MFSAVDLKLNTQINNNLKLNIMSTEKDQDKALNKTDVMQSVFNKKCYPVCSKKHIKKGKCICLINKK